MSGLWGELPSKPEEDSKKVSMKREKMSKPKGAETEGGPIFQPSSRHHPPSNEPLPAKWFQIDPITLHTIRLLQHVRKTRQAIQTIQQQQPDGGGDADNLFPVVPPIPEYDGPPLKHVPKPPFNYLPLDLNNEFARGIGESPPPIDAATNHKLLKRSVAAMLAHMSFEGSAESVLEFLTDVVNEFFLEFTKHLRFAADYTAMHGPSGFPDIMEQVFHEMGFGSVTTLHDFYQTRVINYHKTIQSSCQELMAEYEKLKEPMALAAVRSPSTGTSATAQKDTFNVIRIKEEPSADIQLPVLDENDETDAEHLLQLDGLGNFEITVEHETSGGLTTEVESKWPQSVKAEQDRVKSVDSQDEPVNVTDTSGSVGGQDSVPQTPRTPRDLTGEGLDSGQGPASVTGPGSMVTSPVTPSSVGPSKAKKKKSV